MIAKRVVFSGRVQGVGFRFTTRQIAQNFQVCGWVSNLNDGTVEIQVKGQEKDVRDFLLEICEQSRLAELIRHSSETEIAPETIFQESEFVIRH